MSAEHPECKHERASICDSDFFGHLYSTESSRRIFCDVGRFQRWLDVEAALALAQGELRIIPIEYAERIAEAAHVEHIDLESVKEAIKSSGHSLVGLLRALQDVCGGEAGEFVHFGATTQDIQDTAQALEMQEVLCECDRELNQIIDLLRAAADSYRNTIMVGRTHARAALPMTYGLKVASWLDEMLRDAQRLLQMQDRILVVQLFGAVGSMAGFGSLGGDLLESFAHRLGLTAPAIGWHVARDRVAEYINNLAILSGTLARVMNEVRALSRPEIGELETRWRYGQVGSSTMPHKRNPEACQQVVVLAHLAAVQAQLGLQALVGEHERDSRTLRLEWPSVADVSHYTLASLSISKGILEGLTVNASVMAENLLAAADALCTEALMLALAPHIGKQSAHRLIYDLSQFATSNQLPLREVVSGDRQIRAYLASHEIDNILDPTRYTGRSAELVEASVERATNWLAEPLDQVVLQT